MPNSLSFLTFIILAFTLFISGCTQKPIKDVPIVEEKEQKKLTKTEQFKQYIQAVSTQKQPKKNKAYIDLIEQYLQQVLNDDLDFNEEFIEEYQFIEKLYYLVEQAYLTPAELNKLKLYNALNLQLNNKNEQSLLQLNDHLNLSSITQNILFHRLKIKLSLALNAHKEDTISDSILLHHLYKNFFTKNSETLGYSIKTSILHKYFLGIHQFKDEQEEQISSKNLIFLWNLFSKLSIKEITDLNLLNQDIPPQQIQSVQWELIGWKDLFLLIKKTSNQHLLRQKISLWKQSFHKHMAKNSFINEQLSQHFAQLVQTSQIALLLPLSGKYAKISKIIKNGFLAAHFQQAHDTEARINIYDTGSSDSIWPQYKKAVNDGATVIIGPLNKHLLNDLAEEKELPVVTLALNNVSAVKTITNNITPNKVTNNSSIEQGNKLITPDPPLIEQQESTIKLQTKNLFQFALKPEDEITFVTQKASAQGFKNAAILVPDTSLGKRLEKDYTQKWEELGGKIVSLQLYQAKDFDFNQPITQLLNVKSSTNRNKRLQQILSRSIQFTPRIRQDLEVIFLIASPEQAKQISLQIDFYHGSDLPIFAGSQIISEAFNIKENKYLNGITYPDMPWLLDSSIPAISRLSSIKKANLQRLFTLGVDSYLVLPYLKLLKNKRLDDFKGESGLLSITPEGYLKREMTFAKIKKGKAVIIKSPLEK